MENGYKIGDRVRFLDFEGDGRVSALPGGDILEIEMDGMRMRVSSREVVRIDACDNSQEIRLYDGNNRISQFKQKPTPHNEGIRTGRKSHLQDGRMEVDLHMERIREKYPAARNIPDSDALFVQLDVFEKSMAEAFRKGMRSVVFIHGHGRGILRSELLKRLKEYPGTVVQDASVLSYGDGAIEVFLK